MAGIIVGVVAGFAAFMIQKKITNSTGNKPLIISTITLVSAYSVLFTMILVSQTNYFSHSWDTRYSIGEWTSTAEGMEQQPLMFNNLKIHLNYFLSLIALPTLIMIWIAIKYKTTLRGTINQYRYFF